MPGKRIVTAEQLDEGWMQLVGGVVVRRKFRNAQLRSDGKTYLVDDPMGEPESADDRLPVVDARY